MSAVNQHPMDDFPVRPLRFALAERAPDFVWSRSSPCFAVVFNALVLHVPYFERYLVKAMRQALPHIDDPKLQRDMRAIIGQEANHARVFIEYYDSMKNHYPKVPALRDRNERHYAHKAKTDTLKQLVGYTAGYETFTFLAGALVLQNYEQWLADADPVIKAMFVWHQVEEVEHGAVAFEVYQRLYGDCRWYRRWMIAVAASHMVSETCKAYVHMARVEGWMSNPLKASQSLWACAKLLLRFVWHALPTLRDDYHPRKHPLVTRAQNPIQIAWRRYEKAGGDVLAIDHAKMADIMKLAPESMSA